MRRLAVPVVLAAGLLAASSLPPPADAQGVRIIGGTVGRPAANSWTRAVSEPQRFRIRPRLVIDRRHRAGAVAALHANGRGGLVLARLADGGARVWDLVRGVQVGEGIDGNVVAGAVRGAGRDAEVVYVRSDGSTGVLRRGGEPRPLAGPIDGLDARRPPVLSADGTAIAYRTTSKRWVVRRGGGAPRTLPDAARDARPALSHDGSIALYRGASGALAAARVGRAGVRVLGALDGCRRGRKVTAAVLAPDGRRALLGDSRGEICAFDLARRKGPHRLFRKRDRRGSGAIVALALSADGRHAAAAAESGRVSVWSITGKARRVAALDLARARARPLSLDARRGWLLTGEANGTIAVRAFRDREAPLVARLISTRRGWSVLDREGRFDGSQSGVDALIWAGESAERKARNLPVDAFSEPYFEPGLLAKLDDARPAYLTGAVENLARDGYEPPPAVAIDPVPAGPRAPGTKVRITVRVESGYPTERVSDVRLYHNGKLVTREGGAPPGDVVRHTVRLAPGENAFRALGVRAGGIEGPPATLALIADGPEPAASNMKLVSIGINRYPRPSWELFYARDDAQSLVAALRERSAGLFRGVESATLLDDSADRPSIEARILDQSSSPLDVLVVYFSGHGVGLENESGWEWYLLPYSSEWKGKDASRTEHNRRIRRHGLSSRRLMELLTRTEARRVFLILDSCQSGAVVEAFRAIAGSGPRPMDDAVAQKALRRIARVGGIHVLAASRAHELATELQLDRNGALTYLVLEALRGAADGALDGRSDRRVSVREIVEYASREMPNLAERLNQDPISHVPMGYSRGTDFALAGL